MQVKVAELADGTLAADGLDLLVYTIKDYGKFVQKEDGEWTCRATYGNVQKILLIVEILEIQAA